MKRNLKIRLESVDAPVEEIEDPILFEKGIQLLIKREDLIHPEISGNKWRKLKYNILAAEKQKRKTLLTFGGAYSNHILAVAAAGKEFGFKTIGVIRGEEHVPLNPTLRSVTTDFGMELFYMDRITYRLKDSSPILNMLKKKFDNPFLIPEGGTNNMAIKGCVEILDDVKTPYDYVCCSCGTGGTLAGLICSLEGDKSVLGFSALKGDFLIKEVERHVKYYGARGFPNWTINTDFHFGGYAKFQPELIDFINAFKQRHQIQLDPIYTGKMMFGVFSLIKKGFFKRGTTILAIHTGGLQGIQGFNERFGGLIH